MENSNMRTAVRLPGALRATGLSKSTFYQKIEDGLIPRGTKIDPAGRIVIWWQDELEKIQERAIEAAKKETVAA
jgi:predicted DNA-binding transcriptional regulator AlpA